MSSELDDRLRILEENYEYQDQLVEALNEALVKQQVQIDSLGEELKKLKEELRAFSEKGEQGDDPLPPHY